MGPDTDGSAIFTNKIVLNIASLSKPHLTGEVPCLPVRASRSGHAFICRENTRLRSLLGFKDHQSPFVAMVGQPVNEVE